MLLITGATGLVGGMLSRTLAEPKIALARRPQAPQPGLISIAGDIAVDGLGIDPQTRRELQLSITKIIHCAADVRFTLPIEQARNVNTAGTARLLEFARGCPRLRHFAHISTVYVLGAEQGTLPEARAHAARWISTYEQSKYEAEGLVLDAARSIPAAVYRLSSIVGDSTTGRVHQFNHVHQMLRLMPRHLLPAIPGDADALMDLIPSDAAAAALACLVTTRCDTGAVWNVCAGQDRSWTLGEIIDAAVAGYHAHGHPIVGPRLIPVCEFTRMLNRFSRLMHDVVSVSSHFLPHLAIRQTFACEHTHEVLARAGCEFPHVRTWFARVMRYCLESDWGNRPVSGYEDTAARVDAAALQPSTVTATSSSA